MIPNPDHPPITITTTMSAAAASAAVAVAVAAASLLRPALRAALFLTFILFAHTSHAQTWGDPQDKGCSAPGQHTYASRIYNIPGGESWQQACSTTPITLQGQLISQPTRCNDKGVFGEWGEWDVADPNCAAQWEAPKDNGCSAVGVRTFAAKITNIPNSQSWEAACNTTAITIEGQNFPSPARCNNKGAFGEWGEWDVSDASCAAQWEPLKDNGCSAVGVRTFAAKITNIPNGQSWEAACNTTAVTIEGQNFPSPARCRNTGITGEWGEWDVSDASCRAQWETPKDNGCTSLGTRTFAARLGPIPPGQTWDAACKSAPEIISGQTFPSPARCNDKGVFGEWGEWDVKDRNCFASCEYVLFDPPAAGTFVGIVPTPSGNGYWLVGADGGIFTFGDAKFFGSKGGQGSSLMFVGMAATRTGNGYWLATSDGSVFPFGDAAKLSSLSGLSGAKAIVGITATPTAKGYWLIAHDGTVSAFGDASKLSPAAPGGAAFVGLASTPSGKGYWTLQSNGVAHPFGDAPDLGAAGPVDANFPIVGGSALPNASGYVLAGSNSATFGKGPAPNFRGCTSKQLAFPVMAIAMTPSGRGYWEVDSNGGVFPYGDATVARPATQGGQSMPRMRGGNSVTVFLEGADVFNDLSNAVNAATKSINIIQLLFDTTFISQFGVDSQMRLTSLLASAAARGVRIRILHDKTAQWGLKLNGDLNGTFSAQANMITVRGFPIWEPGRLHSKAVIIDGSQAYLLGATFTQDMFDSRQHPVNDVMHRGDNDPLHTESLKIQGPSVTDVDQFFVDFWNSLDTKYFNSKDQIKAAPPPAAAGSATVQILRTVPPAIGVGPNTGEIEILEAYERAFANARRYIYVEQQYLLFQPILEAIRSAMDRNPALEVVAVVNQNPDQSALAYRAWQARAIHDILGAPDSRLGLFSLWTLNSASNAKPTIRQIYMEGKLAIVDDVWMTLGTANMDGLSQASFETPDNDTPSFSFTLLKPLVDTKRSAEINGAVFDGVDGAQSIGAVAATRCRAWQEHLGTDDATLCKHLAPPGGWLGLWNAAAAANVASLNQNTPTLHGHVLPWVPGGSKEAKSQLDSLGIKTDMLNVIQDDNN